MSIMRARRSQRVVTRPLAGPVRRRRPAEMVQRGAGAPATLVRHPVDALTG
jgi:hypothetical protein